MKVIIQTQFSCLQCRKEIILRVKKTSKISSVLSFISEKFFFPKSNLTLLKDSLPLNPDCDCSILNQPAQIFLQTLFPEQYFQILLNDIKEGSNESFLINFLDCCDQGFSLDKIVDDKGWALIHYACMYGNCSITKNLLVANEKSINLCTKDGWTPLMIAVDKGYKPLVWTLILTKSLKINRVTQKGTALHRAVLNCHTDIVKILIKNKASIKVEDLSNKTCMEIPTSPEILQLIPVLYGQREAIKSFCSSPSQKFDFTVHRVTRRFSADYQCTISVNFSNGRFEEHLLSNSNRFIVYKKKIIKLLTAEPCSPNTQNQFFFEFQFPGENLKYWTTSNDLREQILESLKKATEICRWKEIGIRCYSEPESLKSKKGLISQLETKHQSKAKLHEFEKVKILGSGSFGTVFLIKHKYTDELFALKSSDRETNSLKGRTKFAITECEILKSVNNPFIVKLYWAIATKKHLNLILEYCEGLDLTKIIDEKVRMSESEVRFVLASIVLGVKHLHLKGIVCRDLKPANILLDSSGYFKLCDFGLSQNRVEGDKMNAKLVGSPTYLSPEGLNSNKVGKAADIWALGILTYQLFTGTLPFYALDYESLYTQILEKELKFPASVSQTGKTFLKLLLDRDPITRPTIDQVMSHSLFQGLDWKLYTDKKYEPPVFIQDYLRRLNSQTS